MSKSKNTGTVDFNKAKQRAQTKRILKKLRIPLAVLALIIIFCVVLAAAGETRRSNFMDSFRAIPATIGDSHGYPYNEDELSLSKVTLVGDKPLIVSDSGIKVLSQEGDELYDLHLEWGDTKAITNNGRALIFSNTSGKSYLISRTKTLAEFSEDGLIVTGCVANNGSVAACSTTDTKQSVVRVYNTRQKLIFQLHPGR